MKFHLLLVLFSLGVTGCNSQDDDRTEQANITNGAVLSASCSGCHANGNEIIPDYSYLDKAGLSSSLLQFKNDLSGNTVMHRIMRGYSETEIEAIAEYLDQTRE